MTRGEITEKGAFDMIRFSFEYLESKIVLGFKILMRNAGAIIFKLQREFTRNVTENAKLFIPHHLLICKIE